MDDALWAELESVLRVDKPRKKPGRPRRDDRAICDGLDLAGPHRQPMERQLPRAFGPKSTVHARFAEWVASGALERAWAVLLRAYDDAVGLDWDWQAADGCIVKAPFGKKGAPARRRPRARNPTDRGKPGTKRHLLTEAKGIPVAVVVTGANRHDMKKLADLLDATVVEPAPSGATPAGAGSGLRLRRAAGMRRSRGATPPHVPPKASADGPLPPPGDPDRHPPRRWVVEVGHSWFNRFRRLLTRTEKQARHDLGFVQLAAVLIIYRKVRHARSLSG